MTTTIAVLPLVWGGRKEGRCHYITGNTNLSDLCLNETFSKVQKHWCRKWTKYVQVSQATLGFDPCNKSRRRGRFHHRQSTTLLLARSPLVVKSCCGEPLAPLLRHGCQMAKFDPFLSLDCAPTPSTLALSKERKGSNFVIWQPCCAYTPFSHRAKVLSKLVGFRVRLPNGAFPFKPSSFWHRTKAN